MSRLTLLATLVVSACTHAARHEDPHPCDGYVDYAFERVQAPAPADDQGTPLLVVRCPDPNPGYPELEYFIDDDRGAQHRCGEPVPVAPGPHRVIVPGQAFLELELHARERIVLATTRREHRC